MITKRNKGYSLVEVVVSASIIVLVIVGGLTASINTSRMIQSGNEKIKTSLYASSIIEFISTDEELLNGDKSFWVSFDNFSELENSLMMRKFSLNDEKSYRFQVKIQGNKVTINGSHMSYELSTYVRGGKNQ